MRVIATQHRMIRTVQRLQPEHVRSRAIERKENVDTCTEMLLEFRNGRPRVRIVSVSNYVTLVRARNGFEYLRMHSGIIVAGKTPGRLSKNLWHKKTE